jgi:predicted glycogen debranching enzyme
MTLHRTSAPTPTLRDPIVRIALERRIAGDPRDGSRREWLATTGAGDYALGTASGIATRRYHGLLCGACDAPIGRRMLVPFIDGEVVVDGQRIPLASRRWADGSIEPDGYRRIVGFALEDGTPTWTLEAGAVRMERRIVMLRAERAVAVLWTLREADAPVRLDARVFVEHRGHHQLDPDATWTPDVAVAADGRATVVLPANRLAATDTTLFVHAPNAALERSATWWRRHVLSEERSRGYDSVNSACHALTATLELAPGETRALIVGLSPSIVTARVDGDALLARERTRRHALLAQAGMLDASPELQSLAYAADEFVVARVRPDGRAGRSILAGFPWFEDWGRDAMIALPGLLLETRRFDEAKLVIETFLDHLTDGLLPNRFPDERSEPEYHSADAPLLAILAIRATAEACNDWAWARARLPAVFSIIDGYLRGTRHGIHIDGDGLVCAGERGLQLTWMDAKIGDLVVTPRMGKPIELTGLWIASLEAAALIAADDPQHAAREDGLRAHVALSVRSLARFWNPARRAFRDVVDGPAGDAAGDDDLLRPNQLFLLAFTATVPHEWREQALATIARELLTPLAVRTLPRGLPAYRGRCEGDQRARDLAYHNGTAWPFLLGLFLKAESLLPGGPSARTVREAREALAEHLRDAGLGSVSEITDAEAPFEPRGCPMQAWSVGMLLEALRLPSVQRIET